MGRINQLEAALAPAPVESGNPQKGDTGDTNASQLDIIQHQLVALTDAVVALNNAVVALSKEEPAKEASTLGDRLDEAQSAEGVILDDAILDYERGQAGLAHIEAGLENFRKSMTEEQQAEFELRRSKAFDDVITSSEGYKDGNLAELRLAFETDPALEFIRTPLEEAVLASMMVSEQLGEEARLTVESVEK